MLHVPFHDLILSEYFLDSAESRHDVFAKSRSSSSSNWFGGLHLPLLSMLGGGVLSLFLARLRWSHARVSDEVGQERLKTTPCSWSITCTRSRLSEVDSVVSELGGYVFCGDRVW